MEKSLRRRKKQGEKLPEPDRAVKRPHPDTGEGELSARLGSLVAGYAERLGEETYNLIRRHWLGIVNFHLLVFVVGAMEAPLLSNLDQHWVSKFVYGFYGFFCHQEPSRSLFLFGQQVAICSRCLAFYSALFIFGLMISLKAFRPLNLKWALILILPACVDVLLQALGFTESTNLSRITTGLLLGMSVSLFLFPRAQRIVNRINHQINASKQESRGTSKVFFHK
jgi:uncharacterized membrane protein